MPPSPAKLGARSYEQVPCAEGAEAGTAVSAKVLSPGGGPAGWRVSTES